MLIKRQVFSVEGANLCATITNKGLVLKVEHGLDDEELYNFGVVVLENDQAPFDVDPHPNLNINANLKSEGYFHGQVMGRRANS